ncbi:sigma 54-interacting transcriptional regulator [Salmonella enterica subsp. enterica serovar Senftenberg]|nr:sigma 54-interacting transcriptional regulator [Salmonella enterica subsp. enterica serovar Senftenberg]
MIGEAPAMQDVFRIIGRLSRSSISVLINGESGTGKELVAHALHRHSPRAKSPFIALNMAAIPKDLIESELFGHEKGAFTGRIPSGRAVSSRLTAARCFWTKLAICRWMSRLVCYACWLTDSSTAWAGTRR